MLLNPLYILLKFKVVTFKLNVTKYIPLKVYYVIVLVLLTKLMINIPEILAH